MNKRFAELALYFAFGSFFITAFAGIAAGVSFKAVVLRSTGISIIIGVIAYFLFILNYKNIKNDNKKEKTKGRVIDVSAGDSSDLKNDLINNRPLNENGLGSEDFMPNNNPEEKASEIEPFRPRQIDPDLENIINKDPARATKIMRNMGLEKE